MDRGIDVITGAFSYTGKHVAQRLLAAGRQVRTLTGHPGRPDPFASQVSTFPYDFEQPDRLLKHLQGADTLYCTYWVRYPYGSLTYEKAVHNSRTLFQTAKKAGIGRIVHVSIANPSKDSPLTYYSGKAQVEQALIETGLPYAILRPTVIFGKEDILINNIAWMVRHFPFFAVPGNGKYRLQPIYVEDFADALVQAGQGKSNSIQDAIGPETFTFNELVLLIAGEIDRTIHLLHLSPSLTYGVTALLGRFLGDVVLTQEEIRGLMDDLLVSQHVPLGKTRLSQWIRDNKRTLGKTYVSEIKRHF